MFWCHGVFTNQLITLVHSSRKFSPITYLITDVTGSLYYHQSETKMADSSEDELSDSSGNFIFVSNEDSEDSVREDELENELAAIFFPSVRCIMLPRTGTSFEISRSKNKPDRENAVT